MLILVAGLFGSSVSQTISLGLREYVSQDGTVYLLTKNALIESNPVQFSLDVSPAAESTLPYDAGVDPDATRDVYLTTPSAIFNATFKYGSSATLALSQISINGATLCGDNVYFGEVPSSCSSDEFAYLACSQFVCGVQGQLSDFSAVWVKLSFDKKPKCTTVVQLKTNNGWRSVCTNDDYEFSPRVQGFVFHVDSDMQHTLFFPPRTETGTEEFVLIVVSLLSLMLWASQSTRILNRIKSREAVTNTIKKHRVGVATIVSDIMLTLSFTASYALTRIGITVLPPQLTIQYEVLEHAVLGAYFTIMAVSPALLSALLFSVPNREDSLVVFTLVRISRAITETTLMSILFFFMPNMVGESLRETFGMFLGVAICVVIGRDINFFDLAKCIPESRKVSRWVLFLILVGWIVVQYIVVVTTMLTPVFVESAGISNENAIYAAIVVATGSAGAGVHAQEE